MNAGDFLLLAALLAAVVLAVRYVVKQKGACSGCRSESGCRCQGCPYSVSCASGAEKRRKP